MIAILLVGLFACACAAPHPYAQSPYDGSLQRQQAQQIVANTNRHIEDINRNLNNQLTQLHARISEITSHLPKPSEGFEGDQYKITIPLVGFEPRDIKVISSNGVLHIEAVHVGNGSSSTNIYYNDKSLPMYVGGQGNWSYENSILKIVLPVGQSAYSDTIELTPVISIPDRTSQETERPAFDSQFHQVEAM